MTVSPVLSIAFIVCSTHGALGTAMHGGYCMVPVSPGTRVNGVNQLYHDEGRGVFIDIDGVVFLGEGEYNIRGEIPLQHKKSTQM